MTRRYQIERPKPSYRPVIWHALCRPWTDLLFFSFHPPWSDTSSRSGCIPDVDAVLSCFLNPSYDLPDCRLRLSHPSDKISFQQAISKSNFYTCEKSFQKWNSREKKALNMLFEGQFCFCEPELCHLLASTNRPQLNQGASCERECSVKVLVLDLLAI